MHFIVAIAAACFWNFVPVVAQITTQPPYYQNGSYCTLERDVLYSGYSTDRSLQCYCVTKLRDWLSEPNPPTRTVERTIGVGATTKTITSQGSTITTTEANVQVETYLVSQNGDFADNFNFYGSATSPCCSSCTVAAQTVDLFYFPTPAVKSAATSFVSNNYTFISPSVYIGFTSISAFDLCGNVGGTYSSTTLAFDPSEISTLGSPVASTQTYTQAYEEYTDGSITGTTTETDTWTVSAGMPSVINFGDLGPDCSSGIPGYQFLASEPYSQLLDYDPCHPVIVIPARLKTMLDPAWADCANNGLGGFYDPPSALTHVQAPVTSQISSSAIQTPQPVQDSTSTLPVQQPTTPPAPASTSSSPISKPTTTAPVVLPDPTTAPSVASPSPDSPAPPAQPSSLGGPDPSPPATPVTTIPAPANPAPPASNSPPIDTPGPAPVETSPPPGNPSASNPAPQPDPVETGVGSIQTSPGSPAQSVGPSSIVSTSPGTLTDPQPGQVDPSKPSPHSFSTAVIPNTGAVGIPSAGQVIASHTLQPGGPAVTSGGIEFTIPTSASSVLAIVGSKTLVAGGPAITSSYVVYSLPTGAGSVIVSVITSAIPSAAADPAIGSIILSIIGGSPPSATVIGVSSSNTAGSGTEPTESPAVIYASIATRSALGLAFYIAEIFCFVAMVVILV